VLKANGTLQVKDIQLFNNELDSALINIGDASLANININSLDDVNLEAVNIEQFALLQRSGHSSHKHAVEFSKLDISDIKFSNTDSVSTGSIELIRPVVSMARDETGKYKYEQWLPATQAAQPTSEKVSETASDNSAAFNIKLGNISITDSELCYQQQASKTDGNIPALDYCLNLDRSDWKGNIAVTTPAGTQPLLLSLTGDLNLSNLITTNNLLKRDLLTFERLMVNKVAVNSLEDIVFTRLDLDNVAGLELTTTEDKHTVTVANLDVSDFSFREDSLEVSLVSVNDMGVEITLNEDGSLDLDKWRIASDKQQATDADTAEVTDSEPVKVKIGEFSLDSKRQVEFTDMSVTPKMQIGLAELYINIKNLDSEKPEQKSPLEFRAKTLKHGTIDINGVAMPFESKPSFDATGKITGLDLRVASSKAEQAIGHIIKSGQMDADLKLLSDKGQLDSSISLVLYHFNLKAKSKEDAAALDKKFGMPINQSLMLLKDKKDRIKLKIPITGDVNNPEFDPTDAIIKATAKATTVTLVTFYTPYGLAYAGGNVLFNLATGMNFDPLVFDSGSSSLTSAHESQLSKLTELLNERPGVHLVLCGSTNLGDRDKLFSEIIDPKKAPPPLSAERREKLKQLAVERQESVKNRLVTQGKIAHNRLILCEPEHSDQADALAGVEISI
jgi:outer membrane protein OmpA-like peptidoglycan-associated protein